MVLLFSIVAWDSHAQLNSSRITQYSELNGVPGNEVNHVLVDRQGFVWVGSVNGLARFDGYEFKRFYFNPNDTNSIHGLIVWSMMEDRKGRIWIGCGSSYLNVYTPSTQSFSRYPFKQLVKNAANAEVDVAAIVEDKKGRIWIGVSTYNGDRITPGLLYIDEKDDQVKFFQLPDSIPNSNVIGMCSDKDDNTWVITYDGVYVIDTNRKAKVIPRPTDIKYANTGYFTDVKVDAAGVAWFVTNKGQLFSYQPATGMFELYYNGDPGKNYFSHNNLLLDKDGNLWIGLYKGLAFFNTREKQFQYFGDSSKAQLTRATINDMKLDAFGTLWMATNSEGLLKYEDRAILKSYTYNKSNKFSLLPGWASSIIELSNGKLLINSVGSGSESGFTELDPETGSLRHFPYKEMMNGLWGAGSIYENAPGEIWMGSERGILKFDIANGKLEKPPFPPVPDSATVNYFFRDTRGNFWICTLRGLYKQNRGSTQFNRYDLSKLSEGDAGSNEVTHVYESSKHGLWITTNNGLFLYDYTTGNVSRHGYDPRAGDIFVTQDINSFYEDPAGVAWVGTWQGGLSKYEVEAKKIKSYTLSDGLPSMSVQAIIGDEKNDVLWMSTFDGLCRFDRRTGKCNSFSIGDGIQGQLFADGAFLKTSKGLYCFGGANGITLFNPETVAKTSLPPKVMLTDLRLFDKSVLPGEHSILKAPIYETDQIVLNNNQNNIALEFLALHFSNPTRNRYSYILENYDNDWREETGQRVAYYPKLPPGEYLFRVKASNSNGVWNEKGASLKITVLPPWWMTKWAYVMYMFAFIGLVYAADRYFRRRAVKIERERARARELQQAREIEKAYVELEHAHETLKATQTQLIQSEKMASLGELTAGIAHEIQNPLNFVNNFSEVNIELSDEIDKEIDHGNLEGVRNLAHNIRENNEKITHHGRRADSIVKNMLLHTRAGAGQREVTDLNALCDEYLRLSYHGMRAKDKNFNVNLKTDFDTAVEKIKLIPQDIGRVLLNLCNNALYATRERKLKENGMYEPEVFVQTRKMGNKVQIVVKDNGVGIPDKVIDKIFQPFFTTKPTGKGTGLGLSLTYDIIKAHGGEISVESKEGEGTTFVIQLG